MRLTKRILKRRRPIVRGPIAARLFLFNLLLMFVPAVGFYSLSAFEKSLLKSLEHALSQQARFLAAWLGSAEFSREKALAAVASLEAKHTARIRILDEAGSLWADSSSHVTAIRKETDKVRKTDTTTGAEETLLYRVFSLPLRIARKLFLPPEAPFSSADYYSLKQSLEGPEIRAALSGRYGSATRISSGGQTSVTLYTAVPIQHDNKTAGVVLVSQSTYRILNDLYTLRLEVGKVFLVSIAAAALVSAMLASTLSAPLIRLRNLALVTIGPDGHLENKFELSGRNDEVDELSAALSDLVERLHDRIAWSDRFAADVAHEIKNPLAAIRSAAELCSESREDERRRLIAAMLDGVSRVERIVTGLRNLSLIDSDSGATELVRAADVLRNCCDRFRLTSSCAIELRTGTESDEARILIDPERLALSIGALLDNAVSFAKDKIIVTTGIESGTFQIAIEDDGPGIPPDLRTKVFDRFFSWRPGDGKSEHSGLGLSIVKTIADRAAGSISIADSACGGALFLLAFPISDRCKREFSIF